MICAATDRPGRASRRSAVLLRAAVRAELVSLMAKPFRQRVVTAVGRAYSRDPFERVASIGGVNSDHTRWSLSQPAAIALIEKGSDEFFFQVGEQRVRVVVLTHGGEKYLQSEREKTHPDDLLKVNAAPSDGMAPQPRRLTLDSRNQPYNAARIGGLLPWN